MEVRRALPHSEEAERAVLAAAMLDPARNLAIVEASLSRESFYAERHQILFEALSSLSADGIHPDLLTTQAYLESKDQLERAGGLAYLATLDVDLPDLSRVAEYCEIVRERATRRSIIAACADIYRNGFDGGLDAAELMQKAEKDLLSLSVQTKRSEPQGLTAYLTQAITNVERIAAGEQSSGIVTPFPSLDRILQIAPGNLVVVAGRPGMGKTALAMCLGTHVSKNGGQVLVFTLEMSGAEVAGRQLSAESDVEYSRIRKGQLTEADWRLLTNAAQKLSQCSMLIDEGGNPTLAEIASKARRMKADRGLDLVVLDYLQLMGSDTGDNRNLEIGAISRGLKQIAKELDVPVIVLSQLSRNTERRGSDHRPKLADLRESGAIEQDADAVLFVYRDEIYNPDDDNRGLAEIIVAKNRHGETGTIELAFLGDTVNFRELMRYAEPPPGYTEQPKFSPDWEEIPE